MNNHPKATFPAEEAAAKNIYDHILSKIIVEVTCGFHRAAKTGVLPYSNIMAGSVVDRSVSDDAAMHGRVSKEGGVVKDDGNIQSEINGGDSSAAGDRPHPGVDTTRKNDIEALTKKTEEVESHASSTGEAEGKVQDGKGHKVSNNIQVVGNGNSTESDDKVVGHCDGNDAKKRKLQFSDGQQSAAGSTSTNTGISAKIGSIPSRYITNKNVPATANSSAILPKAHTDIYGRTPGKEPKYTIPCPNNCGRRLSSIRLAQHLEKCLGLSSRRRNSSSQSGTSGRRGSVSASLSSASKGSGSKGGKVSRQGKQNKRRSSKII